MGLTITGKADLKKPMRCHWCHRITLDLIKVHSHEDKSTLRICKKHYNEMPQHSREWDLWVAVAFQKWDAKVYHRDRDAFLVEASNFIKTERQVERFVNNGNGNSKGDSGEV